MGTFIRVPPRALDGRIDATYYRPEYVANALRLASSAVASSALNSLVSDGRRTLYFGTTTLEGDEAPSDWVPFLTSDDLGDEGFFIETRARRRVAPSFLDDYPAGRLRSGELLVKVKGPNQTTGYVETAPDYPVLVSGTIWGGLVRKGIVDPHYLVASLSCPYAAMARTRLRTNLNVEFLGAEDLLSLALPTPATLAQCYIGDKVRQAERLRERAHRLRRKLDAQLSVPALVEAQKTDDLRSNRVRASGLKARLDSKYYGRRAMAVLEAAATDGVRLDSLVEDVSNGFEHREFDVEGTPYITVTEVSGGRLMLATAPRLGAGVFIPNKARIDTRCALVVRTGSIGVAVPVFEEDTHAVISSHLICLRFKSEQEAAAVAAFLNSKVGSVLQSMICYGAVQPQIGQDELLALPIPKALLDSAESILNFLETEDAALRAAQRLTSAASTLVEHLIDGRITEADLITTQKALEAGDRSADREILKALQRSDSPDSKPLIADVDALYALLDEPEAQDA